MTAEPGRLPVCVLADIPVGQVVTTETPDGPVAVFHTPTGLYALADQCTHEEIALSDGFVDDDILECPGHFAQFCLRTGRALTLPATEPVATYSVDVTDAQVFLLCRTNTTSATS